MQRYVRPRSRLGRQRGVMTEVVVVAPLIALVMIGIVQFSKYFCDSLQLNYAAYQASRCVEELDGIALGDVVYRVMPGAALRSDTPVIQYPHPRSYEGARVQVSVVNVQFSSEALLGRAGFDDADASSAPLSIQRGIVLRAKGFSPSIAEDQ